MELWSRVYTPPGGLKADIVAQYVPRVNIFQQTRVNYEGLAAQAATPPVSNNFNKLGTVAEQLLLTAYASGEVIPMSDWVYRCNTDFSKGAYIILYPHGL
jgi:hypothetical protein